MTTATRLDLNLRQMPQQNARCKWHGCRGNLAKDFDDDTRIPFMFCIQCGREHDLNGNLVPKFQGQRR